MDYEAQYDKIYRYCYHLTGNGSLAEDITQEAFLRLLSSDRGAPKKETAYLYGIARNLCIDHFRRAEREGLLSQGDAAEMVSAASEEDGTILRTDLHAALEGFTEEEREMLLLKYVNEEPDAVICRLYGISRFALYRRLKRMRTDLRERLKEYQTEINGEDRKNG